MNDDDDDVQPNLVHVPYQWLRFYKRFFSDTFLYLAKNKIKDNVKNRFKTQRKRVTRLQLEKKEDIPLKGQAREGDLATHNVHL